ncbi:MAG TPA: HU family DNA-binding protein [Gammaproteobacteria bacterium]|nr:HU family DNA-binding protein [Gammaproteobacteria bacterium]
MNKSELVEHVANASDLSKAAAQRAVEAVFTSIAEAMSSGDSVSVVGFGTFSVSDRQARIGRNPKTGENIEIAACKVPKFKAGKSLKDTVN